MKNIESEVLEMNVEEVDSSQSGDERLNQLINGSVAVLRTSGEGKYFATVGNHRITELHNNIEDVESAVIHSVMITNRALIAITEILLKKQEELEEKINSLTNKQ